MIFQFLQNNLISYFEKKVEKPNWELFLKGCCLHQIELGNGPNYTFICCCEERERNGKCLEKRCSLTPPFSSPGDVWPFQLDADLTPSPSICCQYHHRPHQDYKWIILNIQTRDQHTHLRPNDQLSHLVFYLLPIPLLCCIYTLPSFLGS